MEIKALDDYVISRNKSKNIPTELGDIDSLFFDLDKNVNLTVLQNLYESHKQQMKKEAKNENVIQEEEEKEELCLEGEKMIKKQSTRIKIPEVEEAGDVRGKGLESELNFDDAELDDIPDLDNLTLRK